MYVAVKGGETAIEHSLELLADRRRGARDVPELALQQIDEQLSLAVDRVMTEGSCYDRELAALAIKQARGDLVEAIFLLRAYRTTLSRFGDTLPIDTSRMVAERRISSTFKDVPGGQVLGPTFDYTHRLLDFTLMANGEHPAAPTAPADAARDLPRVGDILEREGMLEPPPAEAAAHQDITRTPLTLPASRPVRLQNLARGDEGFLLALAYSTQRGYGNNHPFVGEIRFGAVPVNVGYNGVTVWNPDGKLIGRIRLPEVCGNIAFGGPKRNRLFMAASRSIYALYVGTQGAAPG